MKGTTNDLLAYVLLGLNAASRNDMLGPDGDIYFQRAKSAAVELARRLEELEIDGSEREIR